MEVKSKTEMKITFTLELCESEALALDALTLYGTQEFIDMFYTNMGSHYLSPHEKGLWSLFESVKKNISPALYEFQIRKTSVED